MWDMNNRREGKSPGGMWDRLGGKSLSYLRNKLTGCGQRVWKVGLWGSAQAWPYCQEWWQVRNAASIKQICGAWPLPDSQMACRKSYQGSQTCGTKRMGKGRGALSVPLKTNTLNILCDPEQCGSFHSTGPFIRGLNVSLNSVTNSLLSASLSVNWMRRALMPFRL